MTDFVLNNARDIEQVMRLVNYVNQINRKGGKGSICLMSESRYDEALDITFCRSLQLEIERYQVHDEGYFSAPEWDSFRVGVIKNNHKAVMVDVIGNYHTFLKDVSEIIVDWMKNRRDDDLVIEYKGKLSESAVS